ncbi:hypothetical protein PIB30_095983 [Stylosanthes scabra]|uniref:Uncharacterized protein n=1 Tax=Stylosanthes scabra TaxID=79078 RepID=A0ABU6VWY1_9FABA|nr:hypothetical protein [Stylosanthes scabra]
MVGEAIRSSCMEHAQPCLLPIQSVYHRLRFCYPERRDDSLFRFMIMFISTFTNCNYDRPSRLKVVFDSAMEPGNKFLLLENFSSSNNPPLLSCSWSTLGYPFLVSGIPQIGEQGH